MRVKRIHPGRFLDSDIKEIRILSRDEKKQDDMRHYLQAQRPDVFGKVRFYIGNVRQREAVDLAIGGVGYVFCAAALKRVPSCEFFPDREKASSLSTSIGPCIILDGDAPTDFFR